ncbi:MAG: hypothetical protein PHY80_02595 [Rickettsiales bacterium]|nr:hypothetical protein [Rickettsiales bacterium]
MLGTDDNYTAINLKFNYLNLEKYLLKLYENGISDINIFLLISLEKYYYEGENLKKIIVDLAKLSQNLIININGQNIKFKVNKISFDVGGVLNRHRWIYRYNEEYMLAHNLKDEIDIPENIKSEIQIKAYNKGKQQGFDWFREHTIDALNLILPNSNQLAKNFKLTDGITEIFVGNNEIPRIEYICYEYWLKHPKYKTVEKALNEIRNLPDSVIERTYNHEVEYYIERLENRGEMEEISKFPEMFKKYSKNYLVDETVEHVLMQQEKENNLEFYCFGKAPMHNAIFSCRKAKNNPIIQKYVKNELSCIDRLNRITLRDKD